MPNVNGKKFSYDAKGMMQAKNYAKKNNMNVNYKMGGGKIKYASAGTYVSTTNYKGCGANIIGTK